MEGKVTQNSVYQNLKIDFEDSLKANNIKNKQTTKQQQNNPKTKTKTNKKTTHRTKTKTKNQK